ncbi:MAG: NAD/FAD-binding protein, partial [Hyphomicrobium sp.]
ARERSGGGTDRVSVTYWMNALQPLSTASDVFVTLNPQTEIDTGLVKGRFSYDHPLFDGRALAAQPALWQIQGRNNLWFAGSYFAYGFHEDALQAGLLAAEDLSARLLGAGNGVQRPWHVDAKQSRITRQMPLPIQAGAEVFA